MTTLEMDTRFEQAIASLKANNATEELIKDLTGQYESGKKMLNFGKTSLRAVERAETLLQGERDPELWDMSRVERHAHDWEPLW